MVPPGYRACWSWDYSQFPVYSDLCCGCLYASCRFRYYLYFVSITPTYALCSAMAAVTCLRSLAGFGFPLFAPSMYNALGFGKGDTVLAVVAIVIGCPACVYTSVASITALTDWICRPWIFWYYGERIRMKSRHALAVVI